MSLEDEIISTKKSVMDFDSDSNLQYFWELTFLQCIMKNIMFRARSFTII